MRIERQLKRKHSLKKKERTTTPNFKGRRHVGICAEFVEAVRPEEQGRREPAQFGIWRDLKQNAKKRR